MNTTQTTRHRTAGLLAAGIGAGLLLAVPQNAQAQTAPRTAATKTVRVYGNSTRKVTMELRNASVREAIQQLFLQAKVDYILDPNIVGTTTLKVTNVPFETALRLLIDGSDVPIYVTRDSGVYDIRVNRAPLRSRSNVRTASYVPQETVVPAAPVVEPIPGPLGQPPMAVSPVGGTNVVSPNSNNVIVNPYNNWFGLQYPTFNLSYPVYATPSVQYLNSGMGWSNFVIPNNTWLLY